MKCFECPVSLVCFAGRLDSESAVTLCVKCGRLEFTPPGEELELRQLFCEQRPLTHAMRMAYETNLHPKTKANAELEAVSRGVLFTDSPHIIAEVSWPDTGPGLKEKEFRLRPCYRCEPLAERYMSINIYDLDAMHEVQRETKPGVFELKGARK